MMNLLHDAYTKFDMGNTQSAKEILEELLRIDPLNIEAWEAYMQISETCEELDSLCERILQVPGIIEINRESIFDYYNYLRKNFKSYELKFGLQRNVKLEMMDQFNFSSLDQSPISGRLSSSGAFRQYFIRLLRKVIIIPYVVLLLAGLNLLFEDNSFGLWILLFLTLSFFICSQKKDKPAGGANQRQPGSQSMFPRKRGDQIRYHSELIH